MYKVNFSNDKVVTIERHEFTDEDIIQFVVRQLRKHDLMEVKVFYEKMEKGELIFENCVYVDINRTAFSSGCDFLVKCIKHEESEIRKLWVGVNNLDAKLYLNGISENIDDFYAYDLQRRVMQHSFEEQELEEADSDWQKEMLSHSPYFIVQPIGR